MFFCRAQANGANRVVMRAFGKSQHMQATTDHPRGDKADLSVIESIVLASNAVSQSNLSVACKDTPYLAIVPASLAGSNSISIVISYTHKIGDTDLLRTQ